MKTRTFFGVRTSRYLTLDDLDDSLANSSSEFAARVSYGLSLGLWHPTLSIRPRRCHFVHSKHTTALHQGRSGQGSGTAVGRKRTWWSDERKCLVRMLLLEPMGGQEG
jgi:hypothetical protein